MSTPFNSLRKGIAVRLGGVLLFAAVIALLSAIAFYQIGYERRATDRAAMVVRDYTEKFRHIEQSWEDHLVREKTRLEFSRLLENSQGRWDRLRAYLAPFADSPTYGGLTICNAAGQALFRNGASSSCLKSFHDTNDSQRNHYRYMTDATGGIHVELHAPIWLGSDGMGTMQLAIPLDHGFLWRNAYPDTELFLEWKGKVLASSIGGAGLERGRPGYTGRIERNGMRFEQRSIALVGGDDTLRLLIQAQVHPPFSASEAAIVGVAAFILITGLVVMSLHGWLQRLLPRIESLSQATRLYADEGKPSEQLNHLLQRAATGTVDEVSEVAMATLDMVAALNQRDDERQQAETRLRESEQRFRDIAESAGEFIWEINAGHIYTHLSEGAAHVFGRPVEALVDHSIYEFMPDAEKVKFAKHVRGHALARAPFRRFPMPILRADGSRRILNFSGLPVDNQNGCYNGSYRGTCEDVTEQRHNEEQLQLAEKVFESSAQAILITDTRGKIISVNPAFTIITGYPVEEAIGANPSKFSSGHHDAAFYASMWDELKASGCWAGEVWDRRKSGEVFPKWLTINAVRDKDSGTVSHYVGIFSDISEQKETEARIEHLAYHDALTGLPNRYALNARLEQSLSEARRNSTRLALMFIDLDRFKLINDSLGHDVGDQLLVTVARRIRAALRESDSVARLGGDEFVIVVPGITGPEDAARIAEKVIVEVSAPMMLSGHSLHTSPSIGIGIFPADGSSSETLMKNADAAMYCAKQHGRNNFRFFTADMNTAATERLLLETQLHRALDRKEFTLVFQPQLEIHTGCLVGVEALLRWQHPDRGEILPERFISIAEEIGAIVPIGAWVIEEACHQMAGWGEAAANLRVAVNISVRQIENRGLVEQVAGALRRSGLPAARLELEITESAMMAQPETAIEVLRSLSSLGVRLAIDDFGTGYSSLSYLNRLPNSRLKIDRSFIADLESNSNDLAITEGIIALARSLGLAVTAEGIETPAQLDILRRSGCSEGQGYLFSKPLSAEAMREFLRGIGMPVTSDSVLLKESSRIVH